MAFSIGSLNANGMRGDRKRAVILDWFLNSKLDILYLQETHCVSDYEAKKWNREFGGKGFWSYGTSVSCGVGVIFRPGFGYKVDNCQRDTDGRLLVLDITTSHQKFRLINVYCDSENTHARKQFIESLDRYCTGNIFKIIGGDFNCVMDFNLDRTGGAVNDRSDRTAGSDQIKSLVRDFNLFDVQRSKFPNTPFYTWSRGSISSRLDRFYISTSLRSSVEDTNVHAVPFSDHCVITLYLHPPDTPLTGPSFWKCNVAVLDNSEFVSDFKRHWDLWANVNTHDHVWWDLVKRRVKKLVIKHSKRIAAAARANIRVLENDLDYVSKMELANPGVYRDLVDQIKSELNQLYSKRVDGVKIRSRVQVQEESERPTRYFLKTEQCQAASSSIRTLHVDGRDVTDIDQILDETSKYYHTLFQSEPIDQSLLDYFIKDVPSLKEDDRLICEGPITLVECEQALKAMKAHKSPGLDGLPMEFYSKFFHIIGPSYVAMMNSCFEDMVLPDSQKHGIIKLLCKDAAHPELLKNWRPISLLNLDYKILTKVLTNRLGRVIGKIVHPDQTSSVPGRSILDNIHLMRNLIDYLEFKDLPGILVSLDQQKAFDRVNHHYLLSVLKAYGFGEYFLKWIRLLYSGISSSVLVNGFLSPSFPLTRGVRQGCSLSPLLYILCLEPLLIKFRQDTYIKGVPVPGEQEEARVIAFADDVAITVTDESSVRKILVLTECFESASGSKLNRDKSFGIWLGKWVDRETSLCNLSFSRDTQKFYGVLLERGHISDRNWTKILDRFNTVLNSFVSWDKTIRGRAVIANAMACSKLWYVGSSVSCPSDKLKDFTKSLFDFVWGHRSGWVSRAIMHTSPVSGGMDVVNIEQKLHSLRIMHLRNFILGTSAKWFYFARYFLGFHLRRFNESLYSRTRPHQIAFIPSFYSDCLASLSLLLKQCSAPPWPTLTCKSVYNVLLSGSSPELVICRFFPTIDFDQVFRNVHNNFICPSLRELNWKIAHRILPVKFLLYARNIIKDKFCTFCKHTAETLEHLFLVCPVIQPLFVFVNNFINKLLGSKVDLNNKYLVLFMLNPPKGYSATFLYLISLFKMITWTFRNRICFESYKLPLGSLVSAFRGGVWTRVTTDFFRFSLNKFRKYWPETIVQVNGDSITVLF
jgi:exonuclease III